MSTQIGTVVLPNPLMGDTLEGEPKRAFNERLSGAHGAYQTNRPFNHVYNWNYELRKTVADLLVTYITTNIGKYVDIIDYAGNTLTDCMILNPEAAISEIRDNYSDANCSTKSINVRFLHANP